jgi:hypothetical protein
MKEPGRYDSCKRSPAFRGICETSCEGPLKNLVDNLGHPCGVDWFPDGGNDGIDSLKVDDAALHQSADYIRAFLDMVSHEK